MNAVIYARYSCDNQREESIEGQIRECSQFAEKSGMNVVYEYIDRAFSAKTDNRPEFQKMIKDSYSNKLFGSLTDLQETDMTAQDTRQFLRKIMLKLFPLPKLFQRGRRA